MVLPLLGYSTKMEKSPYFVFAPSAFFSCGLASAGAAGVASPPAGAIAPGSPVPPLAGVVEADGAGVGGAASSFLPQPVKARVKAKRVTTDHETIFFLTLVTSFHQSLEQTPSLKRLSYYTTPALLQGAVKTTIGQPFFYFLSASEARDAQSNEFSGPKKGG